MGLKFKPCLEHTVGVEWELQLLDAGSLDLADGIMPLMEFYPETEFVKPEFIQSCVELNSKVCSNTLSAHDHLLALARGVREKCGELGMRLCGAGTHAFGKRLALITPTARYRRIEKEHGYLGHNQITFASHVHVAMTSGDEAIRVMSFLTPCLPVLMAMSANSPFWRGYDAGYVDYRHRILAAAPNYGLPPYFHDWNAFENFYSMSRRAGVFSTFKDIHWDIRPHPDFGTLEVRVMDAQPSLATVLGVASFVRSLAIYIANTPDKALHEQLPARLPRWIEGQNHYIASHLGLTADYISDERGATAPLRHLAERLIDLVAPAAAEVGEAEGLRALTQLIEHGPGYCVQREIFTNSGSLYEVVRALADRFDASLETPGIRKKPTG